jgi:hypothetical protein
MALTVMGYNVKRAVNIPGGSEDEPSPGVIPGALHLESPSLPLYPKQVISGITTCPR